MNDVITLENTLDRSWNRKLRLMAGNPSALDAYPLPAHAQIKRYQDDIHLHHLDASWPARELIRVPMGAACWQLVAWWIGDGKVSAAMIDAALIFALEFAVDPQFALISALPAGAQDFVEVRGISLLQVDWVPAGFLAVTSGGMWRGLPSYRLAPQAVMA